MPRSKPKLLFWIVLSTVLQLGCASENAIPELSVDDSPLNSATDTGLPGILNSDFFVFVGEKIEMVEARSPDGETWTDEGFDLKYKVLEQVYGSFTGDTIEFRAFDHYGVPPFTKAKHVLLFITKYDGKLYHEKYQFLEVHRTVNGRWAACGDPYRYGDEYHRKTFEPKPLEFAEPVISERGNLTQKEFAERFAEPFYKIENDKATCKMGAYTDELLQIKRDGILKARGIKL